VATWVVFFAGAGAASMAAAVFWLPAGAARQLLVWLGGRLAVYSATLL